MTTSPLEQVICDIVKLFKDYVGDEGTITMEQLKELIDKEVSRPGFQEKIPADDLERAMDHIDKNHDGEVNFNEFAKCVVCLAKGYYKSEKCKGGKGHKGKGHKGKGGKKEEDDE